MRALSWINVIAGVWLIVAGFVLSAGVGAVMAEEICLGIIIAILAAWSATRGTAPMAWLVVIAGVWTLFSPGINYAAARGARTNDIVVGIVVIVLGIANALYRQSPIRTPA